MVDGHEALWGCIDRGYKSQLSSHSTAAFHLVAHGAMHNAEFA
jgi:hypothetical protein